jgi:hypothetical protein
MAKSLNATDIAVVRVPDAVSPFDNGRNTLDGNQPHWDDSDLWDWPPYHDWDD